MTDAKKIELNQTENALAELSDLLLKLNDTLDDKKNLLNSQKKEMISESKKNAANLLLLQETSQNLLHNIDNIISKLDKVLENDGASYNNN